MDTKKLKKVNFGFTLIELLVALFVFSLISAFAFRAVNVLSKAGDQLSVEQSQLVELQKAMMIWERDMHQLVLDSVVKTDEIDSVQSNDDAIMLAQFGIKSGQGVNVQSEGLQQISYVLKDHVLSRMGEPLSLAESESSEGGVPILKRVSSATVEWLPGSGRATEEGAEPAPVGVVLALTHEEFGDVRRVSTLISLPDNAADAMKGLNTLGSWQNETTTGATPPGLVKKDPPKETAPVIPTFSW